MKLLGVALTGIVALLGTAALSDQTMYALQDAALKSSAGATIGTITPGTKLSIESVSSGSSNVTIEGWQPKTTTSVIYDGIDSQVALVRLTDPSGLSVVATKNDPYGTVWNDVRVSGSVASNMLVSSVAPVWATAARFYGQKCSQCHALHQPSEFTANQWPGVVSSMAHNASLSGSQQDLVVRYLQAHARNQ